jgi:hypothetical protein
MSDTPHRKICKQATRGALQHNQRTATAPRRNPEISHLAFWLIRDNLQVYKLLLLLLLLFEKLFTNDINS